MRGGYFGTRPFGVPGCLLGWAAPWAAAHASCPALRAWPLCVPVGGGPPARSPHASLRLGSVDLEARPGPAAAHRHRGQAHRQGVRHAKPSGGVSSACRSLGWRNSPDNSAQAMTHVRLAPKLQTTSAEYVENGLLWARWSALWATNACSAGPLDAL